MKDFITRIAEDLADRVSGPMKFRLILQPLIAVIFAVRDGRKDAREGRPSYFWGLYSNPAQRRDMLRDGWKSVGKIFIVAVLIDAVYQLIVLRFFYPGEALLVAALLAFIPYLLIRGPVNRIARRK